MSETQGHPPGAFCWADLSTPDTAGGKAFYTGLFGWTANDVLAGSEVVYTMFQAGGNDVGGMGAQPPDEKAAGVPAHWLLYFATADADASCAKAASLGGGVVAGPFDVMDVGRMAVLRDPAGAVFAVWQPKTHQGFGTTGEPGSPCWIELATPDAEGARSFYTGLLGWQVRRSELAAMEYDEWLHGEKPVGGLMAMTGPEWKGVPPHWMAYLHVPDCDAAAAKVKELGGKVCVPPSDIPKVGRFSVVNDPQGATFSLFQPGPPC